MPGDRPGGQLVNDLRLLLGADAIIASLALSLVEQRLRHIVTCQFAGQLTAVRGRNSQRRSALLRRKRSGIEQRQHHRARLDLVCGGYAQCFLRVAKFDNPSRMIAASGDLGLTWRCNSNRWCG